jgi:hypothetical protein
MYDILECIRLLLYTDSINSGSIFLLLQSLIILLSIHLIFEYHRTERDFLGGFKMDKKKNINIKL